MTDDQKGLEALLRAYQTAANASDPDALAKLYTETAVVLGGDMPTAAGREAIHGFYTFAFSLVRIEIDFEIHAEQLVSRGDVAFATTESTGTRTILASGEEMPEINRELWVFERVDGEWKIARYMFNKSDTMPATHM